MGKDKGKGIKDKGRDRGVGKRIRDKGGNNRKGEGQKDKGQIYKTTPPA
jgi:hypothetical protein